MDKQLNVPHRDIECGAKFYVDNDKYSTGSVKQIEVKRYTNGIVETQSGDLYHDYELYGTAAEANASRSKQQVAPKVVVHLNGGKVEAVYASEPCEIVVIDEDALSQQEGKGEGEILVIVDAATCGLEPYYQS